MRKLLLDERQVPHPRRRTQSQRTGVHVRRAALGHGLHESLERLRRVGDRGQHRHHVDARLDVRRAQARERAQARVGRGSARLESAREIAVERDQREVDRQPRDARDARQQVDVARDERTLGDDADGQPRMLGQHLEHRPRDAIATLGRLKRIGRRADDDRLAGEEREMFLGAVSQRASQHVGRVLLDEDAALEREPRRHRSMRRSQLLVIGIRVGVAVEHPAMRVARVAVGAAERAADVRIDRPEAHARRVGIVEHRLGHQADVADVLLLADDWQRASQRLFVEERGLNDGVASAGRAAPRRNRTSDLRRQSTEQTPKMQSVSGLRSLGTAGDRRPATSSTSSAPLPAELSRPPTGAQRSSRSSGRARFESTARARCRRR